ncbi:glycosyl transferase [Clostridium sp. P21]|uniref:Glycosyl transferase n=1 Tax=Clostridium muellerianum TaxID=2716538 RepID=A0A7Y0EKI3_9CLOT|nr:glycoside hydrolase family 99-like domain-containing protein [Clostridium muellerianum]NMM65092.1 glycosyl transferase [Clostridium muellerianum]
MKIIAFYLPQFHSIPENDEWWGKGFTEWVNVKQAKSLFEGHYQPRIPLNNNYYCLMDDNVLKWQTEIAKEYGIYGFCIYHYWFEGHKLLEKPLEKFRDNPELNMPYCICWANESWTNAWIATGDVKTLIKQTYGEKDEWKNHFDYFLTFFKDKNYISNSGKPLLVIYRPELIENLNDMLDYWNELAIENGFNGIDFAYQQISFSLQKEMDDSRFKYDIEYQPGYARFDLQNNQSNRLKLLTFKMRTKIRNLVTLVDRKLNVNITARLTKNQLKIEDYDQLCDAIINRKPKSEKSIPGMFVGWDNTPRRGKNATVCTNSTPEKFKYYLTKQILNAKVNYKKDMMFIFAWNEWAEGGYLEPDKKYQYKYLEAIKDALTENNELT